MHDLLFGDLRTMQGLSAGFDIDFVLRFFGECGFCCWVWGFTILRVVCECWSSGDMCILIFIYFLRP